MAGLLPIVAGGPGDQFNASSDSRNHPLGSVMQFADGRKFKYGRAAATQIATGRLCQQTLNDAQFLNLAVPTSQLVGDKTVVLTNGTTAITKDQLVDGYVNVSNNLGVGYLYTVQSNSSAANGAALTVTLYETLQVAWTAASTTATVIPNPYGNVIVHPSPATAMLAGVTPRIIPVSNYGWFQTWGPASVLTEGTVVINERVIDSATADGAVAPTASTAAGEEFYVGVVVVVHATTLHSVVSLRIG